MQKLGNVQINHFSWFEKTQEHFSKSSENLLLSDLNIHEGYLVLAFKNLFIEELKDNSDEN